MIYDLVMSYDYDLQGRDKRNLYVDNVVLSAEGTEEAFHKYEEMKIFLGKPQEISRIAF